MQSIRKKSFAAEQLAKRQRKSPATIAIIVLAVVIAVGVVGYALYVRFGEKEEPTEAVAPTAEIKSIAVLPLDSYTDDLDQIHFTDAMYEAIITNLSRICTGTIRVISRNSASRYKDTEKTLPEIAQELDVDAFIEGSVYPSENQVRITVQLIAMNPERHLWQKDYTKVLKDVYSLQNEVARAIASEIKVTISGEEELRSERTKTVVPEAYKLFTQARSFATLGKYDQAEEILNNVIIKDPGFAQAYSFLGSVYYYDNKVEKAKKAADKAIELDPTLAHAHVVQAQLYQRNFNWEAAELELKKALELDPSSSSAYHNYAIHLRMRARYEDALKVITQFQKIDPLRSGLYGVAIAIYSAMGKFDDAIEQYRLGMDFYPGNDYIQQHYGRMLYKQENYKEAFEIFKDNVHGGEGRFAYIYALAGEREKAQQILTRLIKKYEQEKNDPQWIVLIYTALGEIDTALDWLESTYDEGFHFYLFAKTDFEFDPLRSEPRFQAILKKMNLAD